jgi:O-antigen ligase
LSIHSTRMLGAFGHGYGFNLFGLAPEEVTEGQEHDDIRTPHSVFLYALGYTGWLGVLVFAALQLAIVRLLWRSYRLSGQPAGIALWVLGMGMAFFQESLESPHRAIPFYLLVGMTIAPGLAPWLHRSVGRARPQSLPAAVPRAPLRSSARLREADR